MIPKALFISVIASLATQCVGHAVSAPSASVAVQEVDDDSERCRRSGICEGYPTADDCAKGLHHTSSPLHSGSADNWRLGVDSQRAARRDAALACEFEPAARAERVRDAARWTWKGYRDCAWGEDELRPLSCSGQHWLNLTLTASDALDTLLLMSLTEEFEETATLVANTMNPGTSGDCNMFETTIRIVGGLLSASHLAKPTHPELAQRLLVHAVDVGSRLSFGFNSTSGVAYSDVDLSSGSTGGSVDMSSTSEVATLSLEFTLLARLTGQPHLEAKAMAVHAALSGAVDTHGGLLPMFVNPKDGSMASSVTMLGARSDSYYEYLLKQWVMTGGTDALMLARFKQAMGAVRERLLRRTTEPLQQTPAKGNSSEQAAEEVKAAEEVNAGKDQPKRGGLLYVAEEHGAQMSPKMDHLVCFLPGVLALADFYNVSTARPGTADAPDLEVARELAHTCYQLYRRTPSGLSPEIAFFVEAGSGGGSQFPGAHAPDVGGGEFVVKEADAHSLLRPEAVESLFLMWKVTGDPAYREQAWAVFRAFELWARVEGMRQCMAGDPAAAMATAARQAATAGAQAAAAGALSGSTAEVAVAAGAAAARAAVQALQLDSFPPDAETAELATAVTLGAAQAAVEATLEALSKAGLMAGSGAAAAAAARGGNASLVGVTGGDFAVTEEKLAELWGVAVPRECSDFTRGGGYSNLASVVTVPPPRADKMESFWIAETLKYLFLIFSEPPDRCLHPSCQGVELPPARLPLTSFVFNTEAHPLPVVGPADASLVGPALDLDPSVLLPFEKSAAVEQSAAAEQAQGAEGEYEPVVAAEESEDESEDEAEEEDEESGAPPHQCSSAEGSCTTPPIEPRDAVPPTGAKDEL